MSSIKKNILAVALVAGLGMAGAAAAYNYGTAANAATGIGTAGTPDSSSSNPAGLWVAEPVAYQMLVGPAWNWTMREDLVFDIQLPDNAVQVSTGYTVRVRLNRNNCVASGAPYPAPDTNCSGTLDGAKFNTANLPTAGNGPGQLELNSTLLAAGWAVQFDGYYDNGETASIRVLPPAGTQANPGPGIMLRWHGAQLTSLNELAVGAANGGTDKVDAEFWMVNATNDSRFQGSTQSREILRRVETVDLCANDRGSEVDKYIDVADSWTTDIMPKSRFSWDGRLGSAENDEGYNEQWIDLGDVTLATNGAGSFQFWGGDVFTTVITGGAGDDWNAFDNQQVPLYTDDVFLKYGNCLSGTIVARGNVAGNAVTFSYTGAQVDAATAGFINVGGGVSRSLAVCGFVDSDTVIDDHNNHVSTTFFRSGAIATPPFNDSHPEDVCDLLPLRYNGSTMEIFTINPGSNNTQRSFVRLTNRSSTDGYVSLVGISDAGDHGASQVRVWIPAGGSVQLNASDLENGTNGAIGGWGAMVDPGDGRAHKWRAVVTAEFPGLVASSLVNSASSGVALSNITDSDTRGEQYDRDYNEGNFANAVGERASDFAQETSPDFRGNGTSNGEPGGPNGSDGPAGGTTDPCGNPGGGTGMGHGTSTDNQDHSNEDPYCFPLGGGN